MYGLVNQAIAGLIIDNYGEDVWNNILLKAEVKDGNFLNNQLYDDNVTFNLAIAASHVLSLSLHEVLIAFGKYWIMKTGAEKYGHLMKSGGSNFKDFIVNLPNFHSRVMLLFPDIKPPEFLVQKNEDGDILLHYYSTRSGLTDFMEGLILGLSEFFKVAIKIERMALKTDGAGHDIFLIKIVSPAQ